MKVMCSYICLYFEVKEYYIISSGENSSLEGFSLSLLQKSDE